jgi:hypothetical protein
MLQRALRLCAPQFVGGNADLAETVGFRAEVGHLFLLRIGEDVSGIYS